MSFLLASRIFLHKYHRKFEKERKTFLFSFSSINDLSHSWAFISFQKLSNVIDNILECIKDENVISKCCSRIIYNARMPSEEIVAPKIKKILQLLHILATNQNSSTASTLDFQWTPTTPILTGLNVEGEALSIPPSSFSMDKAGANGVIVDSDMAVMQFPRGACTALLEAFMKGTFSLQTGSLCLTLAVLCRRNVSPADFLPGVCSYKLSAFHHQERAAARCGSPSLLEFHCSRLQPS